MLAVVVKGLFGTLIAIQKELWCSGGNRLEMRVNAGSQPFQTNINREILELLPLRKSKKAPNTR